MHATVQRVAPASSKMAGVGGKVGLGIVLVGIPVALCWLFAKITWYWAALGWAGIGMVGLIGVMCVSVIVAVWRHMLASLSLKQIRQLNRELVELRKAAQIPSELAEAMWFENQRDHLLEKQRALNGLPWEKTVRRFRDSALATEAITDCWTPAAEELALWAQRNLPALYTEDDIEKPEPAAAPDELAVIERHRMEYRSIYWRKQMMDRYVAAIVTKLDQHIGQLREHVAESGNPLAQEFRAPAN